MLFNVLSQAKHSWPEDSLLIWMFREEKKKSTWINIYSTFSAASTFCIFSPSCSLSIGIHPVNWGWYRRLRCSAQHLSLLLHLIVSFCWLMLHSFLPLHVQLCLQLSSLLSLLQCGSPMDCRPFRVVPTPFWHDSHPKIASPATTSCLFFSAIYLSQVLRAALIGYTLARSSKVWLFLLLVLKQVSEPAAVVCISPPTQVTAAAPCSLNLVTSALYTYTHTIINSLLLLLLDKKIGWAS